MSDNCSLRLPASTSGRSPPQGDRHGRCRGPTGFSTRGFSLIELMIVLIIMSVVLIYAIGEYEAHIRSAKVTRARADLEELAKAVRWHNIREEKTFDVGTFTPLQLGAFIGTYLEKAPPLDPWGSPYLHDADLGIVFSTGPDRRNNTTRLASNADDVVMHYIPEELYITKAEYIDGNRNNQIDFGDEVEIGLSRPAQMSGVTTFDFKTIEPESAFGTARVFAPEKGTSLRIVFQGPVAPSLVIGKTKVRPFYDIQTIKDFSHPPKILGSLEDVVIQRRKM